MLAAVLVATACNNGSATPATSPTSPTTAPQTTTQTFTGSLNPNGADTFTFAAQPGTVTATLTSLGSGSTIDVGLSLGTFDGTSCTVGVADDAAQVNTVVTGTASVGGNLCVRVYDVGNVTSTLPFAITVVHQ